ncbi:MAG TPA: amino acid ABC transporter permease [Acetobacteraceae bacterium]|nr:amino acid ABC transporter permease [Acetobacteraceae bacterium]
MERPRPHPLQLPRLQRRARHRAHRPGAAARLAGLSLYSFNLRTIIPYLPHFYAAGLLTIEISALALLISIPLGLAGALGRTGRNRLLDGAIATYVELVRNVPLLVVLYLLFYALPVSLRLSALQAGVLALAVNSTAFCIEIFRGGLSAIPRGQYEAAASLGLPRVTAFRLIIQPQLLRVVFPSLGNQVISVVLGSSVASVIGVPELTYETLSIGSATFRYFELFVLAAVSYIVAAQVINLVWRAVGRTLGARQPAR